MKKVGLIVLGVSAAIALLALDVRSLTMQPDQESIAQEATSQEATPQEATPDVPEELPEELPAETNCTLYKEAVGLYLDPEAIDCSAEFLEVAATGLPDLDVESAEDVPMVGISSWIQRVPVPYDYNWRIPLSPTWLPEPVEASARGPIAVAVDGVPIFHYERRPDVSTSLDNYEARNDTVIQGELDQCGGHSGQGEDYHYHYAPVCLMDKHNPELPIAFGLDGTPIYYGEGAMSIMVGVDTLALVTYQMKNLMSATRYSCQTVDLFISQPKPRPMLWAVITALLTMHYK